MCDDDENYIPMAEEQWFDSDEEWDDGEVDNLDMNNVGDEIATGLFE